MVKAVALRTLDGLGAIGDEFELEQADFDRLSASGAVKAAGAAKAQPAPANKMAAAPANKVSPAAKRTRAASRK